MQYMLVKAEGRAGRERIKRRLEAQRGADAMMREETAGDDDGNSRDDGALAQTRD
jgi:hypothetical protein